MSDELTILTTEHYALQGVRQACLTEILGRSTLFLTAVSGTLVAIGFLGSAAHFGEPFIVTVALLLAALWVLGFLTFIRVVQVSVEDSIVVFGISRIRHRYAEIVPETSSLFVRSLHDDLEGLVTEMGTSQSRWQLLMSSSALVSFVSSAIAGSEIAFVCIAILHIALPTGVLLGIATGIANFMLLSALSARFWANVKDRFPPHYPSDARSA